MESPGGFTWLHFHGNVHVIVIPHINTDMIGHVDGLIRFVDGHTILGNNRGDEYKYWVHSVNKDLKDHHLNYEEIPFFEHKSGKNGIMQ